MVSAADFLALAESDRIRKVTVAGLDTFVRKLTGRERMEIGNRARGAKPFEMHEIMAMGLVTEDGAPLFTAEQALALAEKDGWLAEQLCDAVLQAAKLIPSEADAGN
jgi:hypothetical protein